MKARRNYKRRIIESRAYPLRDGGWTPHVCIESYRGHDVLVTYFPTGQRFPTQEKALEAGTRIGMQKIDLAFNEALVSLQQRGQTFGP
jgi:hypothetical protein